MSGSANQLSVGAASLNCLVVDDSAFMRFHLTRLLGSLQNITVNDAAIGIAAIVVYQQLQPDFVLMAIGVPGMAGVRTVKQICDGNPGARIIMISSVDHTDKVEEAFAAGAKGFISKPVTADMLRMTIERVMNAS